MKELITGLVVGISLTLFCLVSTKMSMSTNVSILKQNKPAAEMCDLLVDTKHKKVKNPYCIIKNDFTRS